jgi:hypothetical protein
MVGGNIEKGRKSCFSAESRSGENHRVPVDFPFIAGS